MSQPATVPPAPPGSSVSFETDPAHYRHWTLSIDGRVATLALGVDEEGGLRPGYKLKLNSYDLGVDIELHDALQRIRFEHPEVASVVVTSARDRIFCSGANIFMLGLSSHAWKVNFCKFTNETRNGMEDASRHSGLKFIAACNGTTAGGGYELALACDEIWLVDDRSSAVESAGGSVAGGVAGNGRAHSRHRQTQGQKRSRGYLLHVDGRCASAASAGVATDRRPCQDPAVPRRSSRARRGASQPERSARGREGHHAAASAASDQQQRLSILLRQCAGRLAGARRDPDGSRTGGEAIAEPRRKFSRWVRNGGRSSPPESSTMRF